MLRSRRVDSRIRVSCAAAWMGTAEARWRISWARFSSSRCSALVGQRGIGGPPVSSGGRRGSGGDHRMDFCPPASSLLRRRLLPRLREACEVGSWSSSGSDLAPVQGWWCDGGRFAAGGSVLRHLLLRRVGGAPWPMFVHRPISRRFTAGDSRLEGMVALLLQRWRDPGGSASQLLFRCFSFDSACVSLCMCVLVSVLSC